MAPAVAVTCPADVGAQTIEAEAVLEEPIPAKPAGQAILLVPPGHMLFAGHAEQSEVDAPEVEDLYVFIGQSVNNVLPEGQ